MLRQVVVVRCPQRSYRSGFLPPGALSSTMAGPGRVCQEPNRSRDDCESSGQFAGPIAIGLNGGAIGRGNLDGSTLSVEHTSPVDVSAKQGAAGMPQQPGAGAAGIHA